MGLQFINYRNKRKRATAESIYDNAKAQSSVLDRAEEVQANLAPEFPSFVKTMLPSHVTGGFWLVMIFFVQLQQSMLVHIRWNRKH